MVFPRMRMFYLKIFMVGVLLVSTGLLSGEAFADYRAGVMHPNGKAYFFQEDTYYRYDFGSDRVDKVATIGVDGWKGLPTRIGAAILHPNGKAYFFKGEQYYRFDFEEGKVDKIGVVGVDGWKGLPPDIGAALLHPNGKAYFFRDIQYFRFDFQDGKVDKVGLIGQDGWKGLPVDIDVAIEHPNGKAYFFKRYKYHRFDYEQGSVDKNGSLGVDGWSGLGLKKAGSPTFQIFKKPAGPHVCLSVKDGKKANGTPVILSHCNFPPAGKETWQISTTRGVGFRSKDDKPSTGLIRNLGKCLHVKGGSTEDGTPLTIWDCHGGANQKWELAGDGSIRGLGDKCLDLKGGSLQAGTPAVLSRCNGLVSQHWKVVDLSKGRPMNTVVSEEQPLPPPPMPQDPSPEGSADWRSLTVTTKDEPWRHGSWTTPQGCGRLTKHCQRKIQRIPARLEPLAWRSH